MKAWYAKNKHSRRTASHYISSFYHSPEGYYCHTEVIGRDRGKATDIRSTRDHTIGYYADYHEHETLTGGVAQLPAGRDHTPRYYPYVITNFGDTIYMYVDEWHDDKEDAARSSMEHADRLAEHMREQWLIQEAEQRIEDRRVDIQTTREQAHAVKEAIKELKPGTTAYNIVVDKFKELASEVRRYVREINNLRTNPYDAIVTE
jgi:hypothetical protein